MSLPTEAQCKRAASLFNDVIEPAFRYAERKRLVARPFAAYRDADDLWEGFPEGWEENVLGMLAAGALFTRPDRVAAFLRGTKQTLREELATMVRRWRTRLLRLSGRRFEPTETAWRLADDPAALYHHLLETAFRTFEWAEARYFDPPVYLHEMAGFLFYAAGELCRARREPSANPNDAAWVPVEALVDRFIAAVPQLAAAVQAEHTDTSEPFGLRGWTLVVVSMFFVDHLGVSFGLLETDGGYGTSERFRTTRLYDVVFERS